MIRKLLIIAGVFVGFSTFGQDADGFLNVANDFRSDGQFDSAIYYFDLAGKVYRNMADFDDAYEAFSKAYYLRDSLGGEQDIALSYLYFGQVEGKRGKHGLASSYFEMALKEVTPMRTGLDSVRASQALTNLGVTYTELDRLDSAEAASKDALELALALGVAADRRASIIVNLGLNEEMRKNYEGALDYYRQARDMWMPYNDGYDIALIYQNLGWTHMNLNNLDSARHYFYLGLHISDTANFVLRKLEIVKNLGDYYADVEYNKDSLIKYTQTNIALLEEIKETESETLINDLRIKYEAERMETQIAKDQIDIARTSAQRTMLLAVVLILMIIGLVGYLVSKRRLVKKDQEFMRINSMLKDQEIKSFNSVLEAQETERKRIASELHDKIGSTLSAAKLYLHHLEEAGGEIPYEKDYTKGMSLLDDAVQDVRTISHTMATGILGQFGLVPALNDLRDTINGTRKIQMKLHVHGLDQRLPQHAELHIYRVVQELVSNALKHSGADQIVVQLTQHEQELNVLVEDNGSGFDVHASGGGIGLKNIENRISILGARMNIDSYRGRGTTVSIDVPIG